MTGPLVLADAPAADLQASTKKYVDDSIAAIPDPPPPLYISDTPPVGVPDSAMWWDSDIGKLFVRYNDGTSTQWVEAVPVPAIDYSDVVRKSGDTMTGALILSGAPTVSLQAATKAYVDSNTVASPVSYTVQSTNETQETQARANLFAAPFDALAYNGMQVNGGCEIDQQYCGQAHVAGQSIDGWLWTQNAAVWNAVGQRTTNAPAGLTNSLRVSSSTGAASGTNDYILAFTMIEGYRIKRLQWGTSNPQPLSIGFWVRAKVTGTGSVTLNGDNSWAYSTSFTVNVADAWEFKTITITGPTTGTWNSSNGRGLLIAFVLAAGSGRTMVPNTWVNSTNVWGVSGTTNFLTTAGNYMEVTGLIVLPGIELPKQERLPFIMRPIDQEIETCQRYYEKSYNLETAPGTATAVGSVFEYNQVMTTGTSKLSVVMKRKRITPTSIITYSTTSGAGGVVRDNAGADRISAIENAGEHIFTISCSSITGGGFLAQWSADARL
jgi:hypothetical protein